MNKRTIKIDGKRYWLDIDKATEDGLLEPFSIRFGQYWIYGGELYIVAIVGVKNGRCEVALVSVNSGGRYVDAVVVEDTMNITDNEWYEITGGVADEFVQAKDVKIKYGYCE